MTTLTNTPRWPLDPTGTSPDNKIVGEIHTLPNRTIRAVALQGGAFYSNPNTLRIVDMATGNAITQAQYKATELYEFLTGRYGQEICGILLITDTSVSNNISVDYQCVGGDYITNSDAIINLLNSAQLDNRPVAWGDIISKPDAFTPALHFHDIGDIYGFEYIVHELERVRQAILMGDSVSHDVIYSYIDNQDAILRSSIDSTNTTLSNHINDISNPHNTTKAQVGLGSVDNFPTASVQQAQAGTDNATFMTPYLTAQEITTLALTPLNAHINDFNNPHQTTKAQVGLGSVDNFATATQSDAEAGTSNSLFMTPLRTAQAITYSVGNALNAHISNYNNPHQTTKAQVGLGSVQNYPVAALTDAQAGTRNDEYMTPYLTAQAISTQALTPLNNHLADHTNPHQVTKAQVGLGNVQNYGIAAQSDVAAATSNALYVTPYAMAGVTNSLSSHIANLSNPHQVTKAQVGLGSVQNYGIASLAEAQAGTRTDAYVTPYLVAQAINAISPNWYDGWVNSPGLNANTMGASKSGFTYSNNAPYTGPVVRFNSGGYDLQVNAAYNAATPALAWRTRNQDIATWNAWKTLVNSDGGNASGTWGINISGNAATATTATSASYLQYQGNVAANTSGTVQTGLTVQGVYNNGYPTPYGNVLTIGGNGDGQLLIGWSGTTGASADNYIRSLRDAAGGTNGWSPWAKIITDQNYTSYAVSTSGGTINGNLSIVGGNLYFPAKSNSGGGAWYLGQGWAGCAPANQSVAAVSGIVYSGSGSSLFTFAADNGQGSLQVDGSIFIGDGIGYNPYGAVGGSTGYLVVQNGISANGAIYSNSALIGNRVATGYDSGLSGSVSCSNWFRSNGNTGWYNQTYAVGIYATAPGYVDAYNASFRANDVFATSDARIKTNIEPIKNARSRLFNTVTGCTYLKNGVPSFGLIAQDIQKEFSEAVVETSEDAPDGNGKLLTVNYGIMIAPVIEAMREMDAQNQVLQEEVQTLRDKVTRMETIIALLAGKAGIEI